MGTQMIPQGFDDSEFAEDGDAGSDFFAEEPQQAFEEPQYEASFEEGDRSFEAVDMTDVDLRLATADYYRAVAQHPFFELNSKAARIVDSEIRTFIQGRLKVLLGMQPAEDRIQSNSDFTEDEVRALKLIAAKVTSKPKLLAQPEPPKPRVVMAPKPAQVVRPTQAVRPAPRSQLVQPRQPVAQPQAPVQRQRLPQPEQARQVLQNPIKGVDRRKLRSPKKERDELVEGEILQEGNRKYKVERSEATGKLFRKDITPPPTGIPGRIPPMSIETMNALAVVESERNVEGQLPVVQVGVAKSLGI